MKRTKSGDKLTDIGQMIVSYDVSATKGELRLFLTLTAYDNFFLNPDYVVAALNNSGFDELRDFKVTRTKIIFED